MAVNLFFCIRWFKLHEFWSKFNIFEIELMTSLGKMRLVKF